MADEMVSAADLRRFALFAGLPDADLAGLAAAAGRRGLSDREVLVTRGEPASDVWWVVAGRLTLSIEHDGRSVVVMTLGPGDMLGWSALREEGPEGTGGARALTTARSVGATELVSLPAGRLREALETCTPAARTLVRRLLAIAAADLEGTRAQLLRLGREGPITAG